MKLLAFLCLSVLLAHIHLSVAGKTKLSNPLKKTTKIKTNLDAKTKHSILDKAKKPTSNIGSYPKQKQPERGYPQYPGSQPQYPARDYPHYPGSQPQYPARGYPQYPASQPQYPARGYPQYPGNQPQYPARGYPQYPANQPQYPARGYPQYPASQPQYPARGYPQYPASQPQYPARGYPHYPASQPQYPARVFLRYPKNPAGNYPAPEYGGGYGSYPGSYINHNPDNKILSPRYGGSFGFGGYGGGGGSPFSHSVQKMGFAPSDQSKGFGRSAAMAVAGGAMAGMALGYGLGRFPHPDFHFHNPSQEYYYNYYIYKRYGMKSSDWDDYSRDYKFNQPPNEFDKFMTSCMKRTNLLSGENQRSQTKPLTTTAATITTTISATNTATTTRSNITTAENISFTANSTSNPLNTSDVTNLKASETLQNNETNDDTVSIVEIGYPALINQMKVKRCTELYVVHFAKHLKKVKQSSSRSGTESLQMGRQGLLFVLMSTTVMLMLHN